MLLFDRCTGPDEKLKEQLRLESMGSAYSGVPSDGVAVVGDLPGTGSQIMGQKPPVFSPKMHIAGAHDLSACENALKFYLPDSAADGAEEYLRILSAHIMGRDALLFIGYGLVGSYQAEIARLEQLLLAHKSTPFPPTLEKDAPIPWAVENALFTMIRLQILSNAISRYKGVMEDIKGQSERDVIQGGAIPMGTHTTMTRDFANRLFEQIKETSKILAKTTEPDARMTQEERERAYAAFLKLKTVV